MPRAKWGRCHAFETGTAAVLALWSEDEDWSGKVSLPVTQYRDVAGRLVKLAGSSDVKLTSSPIYIVGEKGRAKELLAACR